MSFYIFQTNYEIIIRLNDVNDNGPEFVELPYDFAAPENSGPGTIVGTVSVSSFLLNFLTLLPVLPQDI